MANVITFHPTFTQGFIFGQLSILILLAFILKYLFLDSSPPPSRSPASLAPLDTVREYEDTLTDENKAPEQSRKPTVSDSFPSASFPEDAESTEWFNLVIHEIFHSYRGELKGRAKGLAGDEVARLRIERWLNDHISSGMIDPIFVDAISLGSSAPKLSNARIVPQSRLDEKGKENGERLPPQIQIDVNYSDSISVRLTTSLFFNQPVPAFARLPVSLSLALNKLKASLLVTPPRRDDPEPTLTITLQPDLELSLITNSLLGSRAKLANVPKVHELIETRIRAAMVDRGTWKIHLPMRKY